MPPAAPPLNALLLTGERGHHYPRCPLTESEYSGGFVTEVFLLTLHIRHAQCRSPSRRPSLERSTPKLAKYQSRWGVLISAGNENKPRLGGLGVSESESGGMIGWMLPRVA
jgi:hypothetical protein